jgi:hypothetical protein
MRGHARVEGAPAGSPYGRAQVVLSVGSMRPLVEERTWRAMTSGKDADGWVRRGCVGR